MGTMALHERESATQSGMARLDQESRIIEFVEKPSGGHEFSRFVTIQLDEMDWGAPSEA